jgi:hypothetical protein
MIYFLTSPVAEFFFSSSTLDVGWVRNISGRVGNTAVDINEVEVCR